MNDLIKLVPGSIFVVGMGTNFIQAIQKNLCCVNGLNPLIPRAFCQKRVFLDIFSLVEPN